MKEIKRNDIFQAIDLERVNQDKFHPLCKLKKNHDNDIKIMACILNNSEMLSVLVEKVGDISKALQGEKNLEKELIQAASICVRWLEVKDPSD